MDGVRCVIAVTVCAVRIMSTVPMAWLAERSKDKLLQHARKDAPLVALSFECQLFEEIPAESHDIFMDKVVTEDSVYVGKGRS